MTRHAMMTTVLAAGLLIMPKAAAKQTNDEKLRITAWAVNMSNVGTGASARVELDVDRWTTPEGREKLIAVMIENGPDALLEALRKMPSHGRMRFPDWQGPDPLNARLGWDLRYAWQNPHADGGRRIVLATDRYIGFWEAVNRPRTIDYPFTVVEMHVDKNGEGSGKLSIATKINFDKRNNLIELETYASEPVRLQQVKVSPKT